MKRRVWIILLVAVSFVSVVGLSLMGCASTADEFDRQLVAADKAVEVMQRTGTSGSIHLSTHPTRAGLEEGIYFDTGVTLDVVIKVDPRLGTDTPTSRPAE